LNPWKWQTVRCPGCGFELQENWREETRVRNTQVGATTTDGNDDRKHKLDHIEHIIFSYMAPLVGADARVRPPGLVAQARGGFTYACAGMGGGCLWRSPRLRIFVKTYRLKKCMPPSTSRTRPT